MRATMFLEMKMPLKNEGLEKKKWFKDKRNSVVARRS